MYRLHLCNKGALFLNEWPKYQPCNAKLCIGLSKLGKTSKTFPVKDGKMRLPRELSEKNSAGSHLVHKCVDPTDICLSSCRIKSALFLNEWLKHQPCTTKLYTDLSKPRKTPHTFPEKSAKTRRPREPSDENTAMPLLLLRCVSPLDRRLNSTRLHLRLPQCKT